MAVQTVGKNLMLDALGGVAVKARLYDTGGAEILDHADASQDKTIAWNAASGSSMAMTSSVDFQVKAGKTVGAISFRSTDGNTEYARDDLPVENQESYANDGVYTLSSATISLA